jgi:hypothetical protein
LYLCKKVEGGDEGVVGVEVEREGGKVVGVEMVSFQETV